MLTQRFKILQAAVLKVLLEVLLKLNGYMECYLLRHWRKKDIKIRCLSAIVRIIRTYTKTMSMFCFKNQSSSCAHYISLVAAGTV